MIAMLRFVGFAEFDMDGRAFTGGEMDRMMMRLGSTGLGFRIQSVARYAQSVLLKEAFHRPVLQLSQGVIESKI